MNHERDERWAYVVLAALVVGYIVYRTAVGSDFTGLSISGLSIRLPELNLGKFGKSLPYLFAPLFAVVSELIRRKKARAAREEWEHRARTEGVLRKEENVKVKLTDGARGSVQADVRLTRAALYVIDRGGRRNPMRFVFLRSADSDVAVLDVYLLEASTPAHRRVRVRMGGAAQFVLEFESREGEAWWSSLRHALGKSTDRESAPEPPREP
ncbi:hypothetical protein KAW64_00140 [bacterium]|nr:hypothetical protein [bacterium]